jgi:site-specific recombinase XerC
MDRLDRTRFGSGCGMNDPRVPGREEAVDGFLRHLDAVRRLSPHTVEAYRRDLRDFVQFFGEWAGREKWAWTDVDRLAVRS